MSATTTEDRVDTVVSRWEMTRPDIDPSPLKVIFRIQLLSNHLARELGPVFKAAGLDAGLFDVLATLRRSNAAGRLSPRELNTECMLTSGAMTARLDRLENAGLVRRMPDPGDRRAIIIELLPKGRTLVDEVMESHMQNEERLLAPLSADERERLAALLRQLLVSIET
jgi:DNA-binding MarR family transcriptional regulator